MIVWSERMNSVFVVHSASSYVQTNEQRNSNKIASTEGGFNSQKGGKIMEETRDNAKHTQDHPSCGLARARSWICESEPQSPPDFPRFFVPGCARARIPCFHSKMQFLAPLPDLPSRSDHLWPISEPSSHIRSLRPYARLSYK